MQEANCTARSPTQLEYSIHDDLRLGVGVNIYVGQTRSAALIARLAALGIGECTNRGQLPPRRRPFFVDNAAFADFKAKRPFNFVRWTRDLSWMVQRDIVPDFIVLPDRVAGGIDSLNLSLDWRVMVPPELDDRCYLVVQDGMRIADVEPFVAELAGLFVGGTLPWKLETGAAWAELAHRHGRKCHIGRVGTPRRVRWAFESGADSIDSSLPLRNAVHLEPFLDAVEPILRPPGRAGDFGRARAILSVHSVRTMRRGVKRL